MKILSVNSLFALNAAAFIANRERVISLIGGGYKSCSFIRQIQVVLENEETNPKDFKAFAPQQCVAVRTLCACITEWG